MKKFVIFLVIALFWANHTKANPITPESLFAEVYFENNEWYLAIENYLLITYGIEDFENIQIFCNNGLLLLKSDFLPDFTQGYTILSNENLTSPIEIERSGDIITSYWYDPGFGNLEFTTLEWNDVLPSPVLGPLEGQALSIIVIPIHDFFNEWWLVKNNDPLMNGGNYSSNGVFSGYVYDLHHVPLSNARIDYIESYYIEYPFNVFDTLITNDTGYFSIPSIPARNYYISNIYKNNQAYEVDEYISIEPDSVNFYEFTIDYIVGQNDIETAKRFNISNAPNPFVNNTEFIIDCKSDLVLINAQIRICSMEGKVISVFPINNLPVVNGKIRIKWLNSFGLDKGQYIYSLHQDNELLASGKMLICE